MNKQVRRLTLGVMVATALLAAAPFAAAQATVKMSLAHNAAPGNPKAEGSIKFAEIVRNKSNGRIQIQVAGASQLGDDLTVISGMRTGTIHMSANSQGAISSVVPEVAALGMPFLFASMQQAWTLLDGPIGQELASKFEAKNLVLLAWFDGGVRHTTNNKRPIEKPEDVKGLKVRTPNDPVTIDIFQTMGAETQQINFSELYIALQQGVVDGQENPLANILSSKVFEVQKYISLTGHKYETTPLVMSLFAWRRLSDADKKLVMDAAAEATVYQRKMMAELDDRLLAEFSKNPAVKVNKPNLVPFRAATQKVWDKWEKDAVGPFVKKLRASVQ